MSAETPAKIRSFRVAPPHLTAKYDAAQTTAENAEHWKSADGLSADAANSPAVRKKLRDRARYEEANNSYLRAMATTLANDCIGHGPRLQLQLDDRATASRIERSWNAWCKESKFFEQLRISCVCRFRDGECFWRAYSNPNSRHPVQLRYRLYEGDQVSTPFLFTENERQVDGIEFDEHGEPSVYHFLKSHPGGSNPVASTEKVSVPASLVIHDYVPTRPGQSRGIPECMPALPLFAHLRRYTLAVIGAAEIAAMIAGFLETQTAPQEENPIEPMDVLSWVRNQILTLPSGWKMSQLRSEQPTNTYRDFKREVISEAGRCALMPYGVVAGDSSSYNYASMRGDNQTYDRHLAVDRSSIDQRIVDRVFAAWWDEASLVSGVLDGAPPFVDVSYGWIWTDRPHVDPSKEAASQSIELENNTTTLQREYAKKGRDWEEEILQRAREVKLLQELGLPIKTSAPLSNATAIPAIDEIDDPTGPAE